jgi:hypothetical protein
MAITDAKLKGRAATIRRLLDENRDLKERLIKERKLVLFREMQWNEFRRWLHTPRKFKRPQSFIATMDAAMVQSRKEIMGAG